MTQATQKRLHDAAAELRGLMGKGRWSPAQRATVDALTLELRALQADDGQGLYRTAFSQYLRYGSENLTAEQRNILGTERRTVTGGDGNITGLQGAYPGATSGFFCPVEFSGRVESAMAFAGPMLDPSITTILTTERGTPLGYPIDNDTVTEGHIVDEATTDSEADVANLGQVVMRAYKYSSKVVKMSMELVTDTGFDLDGYLAQTFGRRIGRIFNKHATTGTGTGQPAGIVPAAALGAAAAGSATNTGGAETGGTSIGWDDLVSLEASVDPSYRRGFMMHPNTSALLKKLKDRNGRPIWDDDYTSLLGYPLSLNPIMATVPTTPSSPVVVAKSVLFGDFSKYLVRRVGAMWVQRLTTRYVDFGQVAFIAFSRMDGRLLEAGVSPVKYLSNTF